MRGIGILTGIIFSYKNQNCINSYTLKNVRVMSINLQIIQTQNINKIQEKQYDMNNNTILGRNLN